MAVTLGPPVCAQQDQGSKHLAAPPPGWSGTSWELAFGFPGNPPSLSPSTIQKFLLLFAAYQALDADTPISFAQWILANGVTDPREQICLLWLYWNYVNRAAVD